MIPSWVPERFRNRDSRQVRLLLAFSASIASKVAALGVSLLLVSLCIGYLGDIRFGILMAVLSLPTFLSFLDFGIPNSAMNRLSVARAGSDEGGFGRVYSTAFAVLVALAALEALSFLALRDLVDLARFFSVPDESRGEFARALSVYVLGYLFAQPFTLVQKVRLSRQESWLNAVFEIFGSMVGLSLLLVSTRLRMGAPALAGAMITGLLAGNVANFLFLARAGASGRISTRAVSRDVARGFVSPSLGFLLLQATGSLAFGFDGFLVMKGLGPAEVGDFSVHQRLYQIVPILAGFVFLPIWPMYTDAVARGDMPWLRRSFLKVTVATALGGLVACALMFPVSALFIPRWSHGQVEVDRTLLLWIAGWSFYMLLSSATSILLNALGKIWPQVLWSLAMLATCVPGKFWGMAHVGLEAVPIANLATNIALVYVPTTLYAFHLLYRKERP